MAQIPVSALRDGSAKLYRITAKEVFSDDENGRTPDGSNSPSSERIEDITNTCVGCISPPNGKTEYVTKNGVGSISPPSEKTEYYLAETEFIYKAILTEASFPGRCARRHQSYDDKYKPEAEGNDTVTSSSDPSAEESNESVRYCQMCRESVDPKSPTFPCWHRSSEVTGHILKKAIMDVCLKTKTCVLVTPRRTVT